MTEHTDEQLKEVAIAITTTMYEMGQQFGLSNAELASAMIIATGNIGYAAWSGGIVEQLRNAADFFEEDLIGGQSGPH
jgi:hypothetical protein